MNLAKYKFQSWLRKGIGTAITRLDTLGVPLPAGAVPVAEARAIIKLDVNINDTAPVTKAFQIIGPADIIGFSPGLVIRTEPVNWNTNFPPNYLAHIEFYDDDLPWRYTPAQADPSIVGGQKLRPWIFLLVLKESEFTRVPGIIVPLSQIKLNPATPLPLPPQAETCLWAHVQTIESSTLGTDDVQPDHIISRLVCPRKLEPNTAYHAFVIPAFESGRMAGLGEKEHKIKLIDSLEPAWGNNQDTFPIYYEWYFHTGNEMDFEYLASLLKARNCDGWVGRKPLDCSNPGFDIPPYTNHPFMLYFEGALKSPQVPAEIVMNQGDLDIFGASLRTKFRTASLPATDPVVSPPFYGQKHIFEEELLLNPGATWIHELNRDPRWRVPAGFGGEIMRRYQDHYLQKAWEQVESIVAANKIIAAAVNTLAVSKSLFKDHFASLPPHELNSLAAPLHGKILRKVGPGKFSTLAQQFKKSCFNGSIYGTAFRRLLSKRGAFRKKLESNGGKLDFTFLGDLVIRNAHLNYSILEADQSNPFEIKTIAVSKITFNGASTDLFQLSKREKRIGDNDNENLAHPIRINPQILQTALKEFENIVGKQHQVNDCTDTPVPDFKSSEIDPVNTIPILLDRVLTMPGGIWFNDPGKIKPALAYPDFEDPMWEKLNELSTEWLIPNLHLIPNNTVTLLQPNQKFIESFMVGLNVEMNREMRWREYPTDERGSCFRQFWDVKGVKDLTGKVGADKAKIAEQFKDISPIDTWKKWETPGDLAGQELGSHNKRATVAENDQLVLALRGDLFKCFPNLSVYASKAIIDNISKTFRIDPANHIKFPVFKADVGADVKFSGFDLTKTEAIGNIGTGDPGWFFIIQETPGETRFGLDIIGTAAPVNWDEISWPLLGENAFIHYEKYPAFQNIPGASWGESSADMAYILYQKPVMIAIHASEMLKDIL